MADIEGFAVLVEHVDGADGADGADTAGGVVRSSLELSSVGNGWDAFTAGWAATRPGPGMSGHAPLITGWLRVGYAIAGVGRVVGLRPNAVTAFRLALSVGVVIIVAQRGMWPILAAPLVVVAAIADTVDGALAAITGTSTRLGKVYDALADRLSEACWLIALALLGAGAWLVAACGGLTWLHDELRDKAADAGMTGAGIITVGERPTRTLVVASALFLAGLGGSVASELPAGTATAACATWALLQTAALLQLFSAVRCALR